MGGGTANLGLGGESRVGVGSWWLSVSSLPDLLAGGGGGGAGPLLDVDGVTDSETLRGAAGGGGGGALIAGPLGGADGGGGGGGGVLVCVPCFACSCFKNSMIKSWLSRMKSSSRPWAFRSSPKCSLHKGSKASRVANSEGGLLYPFIPLVLPALIRLAGAAVRGDSGGVAAGDECLCPPNRPPKRPWCLWWCA